MNFSNIFSDPPKEYSATAFWFWYGTLEKDKLEEQITEMVDKGIYGAFMHARAYLKTPYLEQEWWDAVKICVDKSKELGLSAWLYDEYAWPSGTAGSTFEYGYQSPSRILNGKSENMAKGLVFKRIVIASSEALYEEIEEDTNLKLLGIYYKVDNNDDIKYMMFSTVEEVDRTILMEAIDNRREIVLCYMQTFPKAVDYLNKKTIKEFINATHERYKEHFNTEFGGVIPGIFFDEIYMASSEYAWTEELPDVFNRQWGYNIMEKLPLLLEDNTAGKSLRLDYYRVVASMYEEAFFKQIANWCKTNNLMLTGHTEEELANHPRRQGDYFRTMRHLQIPGADCHDYRYSMPRKISIQEPKYSVSVARAYGQKRALSEALGGAGWGCSLQEYRRGIHTLAAMGINLFCLHGFYYECDHQGSQADWPASFFYQNPYWKYFKIFSDEIRRISLVNSIGEPVVENVLFYPIADLQSNMVGGKLHDANRALEASFHRVLYNMVNNQADIDFIDEDTILASDIEGGFLLSGGRRIRNIFINEDAMMSEALKDKLHSFESKGGHILYYQWKENSSYIDPDDIYHKYLEMQRPDIKIIGGDSDEIYTNHRIVDNTHLYFVTNSDDRPKKLEIAFRCTGRVSKWYPESGASEFIDSVEDGEYTIISLSLKEDEAVYIMFEPTKETNLKPDDIETKLPRIKEDRKSKYQGYQTVTGRWNILPLETIYDHKWNIDAKESRLSIPIALFSSDLHRDSFPIRICNTPWESGACSRHLSLWNASWITRRHHWGDGMMQKDLYFRKKVALLTEPERASLCIAAVNEFSLYVNGTEVIKTVSNCEPIIVEIGDFLKRGDNLIAIHVHNENPFMGFNIAEAETLPKDRMISLLVEGSILCEGGQFQLISDSSWIVTAKEMVNWMLPDMDYDQEALDHDASKYIPPAKEDEWLYAWERGKLPLHPWGDLPLFGKMPEYGFTVYYSITLPCGTVRIMKPEVEGDATYTLDGVEISWEEEMDGKEATSLSYYNLIPHNNIRTLQIHVKVSDGSQGLKTPVDILVKPFAGGYGEWSKIGLPWFSGRVLYKNCFYITSDFKNQKVGSLEEIEQYRYVISLGGVCQNAEVWINGSLAGVRVWEPYQLDITEYVKAGENEVAIIVANSAAVERQYMLVDEGMAVAWNRYWNEDNIYRESEDLISGLMGPVRIYRYLQTV